MKKYYLMMVALFGVNCAIAQWTALSSRTTSHLSSVYFPDVNTGYAAGELGTILKTSNAGLTWTALSSGTSNNLNAVHFTDDNTGFAVGDLGTIIKTSNAGLTWSAISSGTTEILTSLYFPNATTGFAVGHSATILKTIDGGTTWTNVTPFGVEGNLASVYFTDAKRGYAVGGRTILIPNGAIVLTLLLLTEDGGTTWGDASMGTGPLTSVYCTDTNACYAVGGSLPERPPYSEVFKMKVNGDMTTQISRSGYGLNSVYFANANTGYAVGFYGTIMKTSNGGTDWTIQNSGTPSHLSSVYFTDANTGYAVGDMGTILKTTNGGNSLGVNIQLSTENSLKIYPNPSSDNISIETTVNQSHSELSILNINGQKILTRQITEAVTQINVSTLPGGVYEVQLIGEKGMQTGKFIKH
ncbi:MAG: YCF48-related protein [Bacteroidetes bacterium]|nr:YCF48-related protein [Bacteroidota bacterium]